MDRYCMHIYILIHSIYSAIMMSLTNQNNRRQVVKTLRTASSLQPLAARRTGVQKV